MLLQGGGGDLDLVKDLMDRQDGETAAKDHSTEGGGGGGGGYTQS